VAEAVILVGVPGAGKTTYYRAHLAETHTVISGDIQGAVRNQMALLDACIQSALSFAVDNTNVTRAARAPLIRKAKDAGYRMVCCFFDTPVRTAIGRNNHRGDKKAIPVPAILKSAKQLQPPAMEEGFDELRVIRLPNEGWHT
jgi:predicted kinase